MNQLFHFSFWPLMALFLPQCTAQTIPGMQEISQNGMTVTWKIAQERLLLTMRAPTSGWVAVGFNTLEGLAGTNLVMAAVEGQEVRLSDRYIVAPGDHRSVAELGGKPSAMLISGTEDATGTIIQFALPLHAADSFHVALTRGQSLHLLMAFSREDDFAHHSMMRTAVTITL
jgi:DOMON domain